MTTPVTDSSQKGLQATMRLLAAGAFASGLSIRLVDPMLPTLAEEFGRTPTDLAPTVTAFTVAYGLFTLIHGPLGDRRGKLHVIAIASMVAAIASIACAFAPSAQALVLFRFLAGAACAAVIPLSLAWIGDNVDFATRQATLARFAAAPISGFIVAQAIGGLLADTLGWRIAFAVPATIFVAAGIVVRREAARLSARPSPAGTGGPGRGILPGYAALLQDRWARFLVTAVGLEAGLTFAAMAFVPTYLHLKLHTPLWLAGLMVAVFGVGGLLFSATAKRIVAKLGTARMALAGGAMLGLAILAIGIAGNAWIAALACMVGGFGFYMLHNTLQTQATQVSPQARGTAIAVFALSLFVGQSIGVSLAAGVIDAAGYGASFAGAGLGIAALGAWVSVRLRQRLRSLANTTRPEPQP